MKCRVLGSVGHLHFLAHLRSVPGSGIIARDPSVKVKRGQKDAAMGCHGMPQSFQSIANFPRCFPREMRSPVAVKIGELQNKQDADL